MHWRKERGKYIYRYRDENGRNLRVPIASYEQPKSDAQANALMRTLAAKYDERKARELEQSSWHEKYYNFKSLVNIFDKARRAEAPNSWESKKHWFNYVLNYFLNIKQVPNLNEWKFHFEDFKDWLLTVESSRFKSKKTLAYASRNHIINELNCFLRIMAKKHKCEPQPKLDTFPATLVDNNRDADSLVQDEEFMTIYNALKNINEDHASFYYILRETGMRLNELRGISLQDVRAGQPPEKSMVQLFSAAGIKNIKGYLVLRHQPVKRSKDGELEFKALKSKPKISNKYNRYIPIIDKTAWNILKSKVLSLKKSYENKEFGDNLDNYSLWFDIVSKNNLSNSIRKAYSLEEDLKYKSPHCLRHTKATELAGLDFTEQLAKMILGHTSKTTQRYIHLKDMLEKSEVVGEFSFDDFE